tara:strand:+ start:171 stop:836 length:666 start_codon:yes stop_codon:yes gene_type:complete
MINYVGVGFIWYTIHFIISKLSKGDRTIYGEYNSLIHSTTATILSYHQYSNLTSIDYKQPIPNTECQNLILFSSFMFYIVDLLKVCIPNRLWMYIIHHLSSMSMIGYFIIINKFSNISMNVLFFAESSVPLYILYKYLTKYYEEYKCMNSCLYIIYSIVFTLTRVFYMGDILCMYLLFSKQNKIIVFIPGIIIYGGSFMWSCNMCKNIKNNLRDLKRESIK